MATVKKSIYLKKVTFRKTKHADALVHDLKDYLVQFLKKNKTIGSRHWPEPKNLENHHDRCMYINRWEERSAGLWLQICSYVKGHVPHQAIPQMDSEYTDLVEEPLTDADGNSKELVHPIHAVVVGEAMLLDLPRGAGGNTQLQRYLEFLLRKQYPNHAHLHLIDLMAPDVQQMIRRGGGAVALILRLAHTPKQEGSRYARPLAQLMNCVGNANTVTAIIGGSAKTQLSESDILAAYEEVTDTEDLDSLVIVLRDGDRIKDTSELRMRRVLEVETSPAGNPLPTKIRDAMFEYLKELQKDVTGSPRVLDPNGKFLWGQNE